MAKRSTLIFFLMLGAALMPGIVCAQSAEESEKEYEFVYLPEDVAKEKVRAVTEIYENYPVFTDEWREELGISTTSGLPFVIDFNATWCGPCLMFAPTFKTYANKYAGKIDFAECDVDQHRGIATRYGVRAIPNIVLFTADGTAIRRFIGAPSASEFDEVLQDLYESGIETIDEDSSSLYFHIDGTPASADDKGLLLRQTPRTTEKILK